MVNDINMDYIDAHSVHDGRDIEGRPVAKKKKRCNRTPEFHTERDLFALLWHKFCGKLADAVNHRRANEMNPISEASLRHEWWYIAFMTNARRVFGDEFFEPSDGDLPNGDGGNNA